MVPLYTPPPGYYDKPWAYVFDGDFLANGTNAPNQFVYVEGGGLGDFLLRRVVGLSRLLNPTGGQFQMRDQLLNYVQEDPLKSANADEIPIVGALPYPETTALRFDLYTVLKATVGPQLCFHGVRRIVGRPATSEITRYRPRAYVHTLSTVFTSGAAAPPIVLTRNISNYGFDLLEIRITYTAASGAALSLSTPFTKIQLYDMNKQQLSNAPVLDLYLNGAPGSVYKNGAIVPALYYDVESLIRIDIQNLGAFSGPSLPVTMNVAFIGEQRIPC